MTFSAPKINQPPTALKRRNAILRGSDRLVSAVIITFNEEANLERTLSQLYWCDEIVVVDSYSTDNTLNICRKHDCRIIQRTFAGYGDQKQFAVRQAKNDWVMCIDADEYLSSALVGELLLELKNLDSFAGFSFPMNLVFRGYEFKYGKESNRPFIRLFNRNKGRVTCDKLHERLMVQGPVKKLKNPILHFSYRDTHQYFLKFNTYTTYGAEQSFLKNKRRSKALIIFSIPLYFLKYYFIERNFLNGINGFYWSTFSAGYHFIKYIKLHDLQQLPGKQMNGIPSLQPVN